MSKKEEFKSVLKYGWCEGGDGQQILGYPPGCHEKNPGRPRQKCPQWPEKECTCCPTCRHNCSMVEMVRKQAHRTMEEKIRELTKGIDEETLKIFRDRH